MIARFLEQEKALSQVLLADKKARHLVPSWQDMALLESVSKALGPLVEFTDALSGEMYVSVSFLKPVLPAGWGHRAHRINQRRHPQLS